MGHTLKGAFQASEIEEEHLSDDGDQSDLCVRLKGNTARLSGFLKFYAWHATPDLWVAYGRKITCITLTILLQVEVLMTLAFGSEAITTPEVCFNGDRENSFFSVGSGGGYWGMAEEGYRNDEPCSSATKKVKERTTQIPLSADPRRNFDASYWRG